MEFLSPDPGYGLKSGLQFIMCIATKVVIYQLLIGSLANIVDPDEMPDFVAFYQGLLTLLSIQTISRG